MTNHLKPNSGNSDRLLTIGDLDKKLVFHLWEVYSAFLGFMDVRSQSPLHTLSLTQWRVLNLIHFNPGCSQSTLAKEIHINRASMSSIISDFEKRQLILRKPAQRRNAYAISMTAIGNEAITAFYKEINKMEKEISAKLGSKKVNHAIETLKELHNLFLI